MARVHLFALAVSLVAAACGGAVADDTSSPPTQTTLAAPGASPASGAPYGTWDLVSLERESGKRTTEVHNHFYMELRADGRAIARRCTKPYYEPNSVVIRCADSMSYDCSYGSVREEADGTWRVEFPDLDVVKDGDGGEVVAEPNGGILVRHIVPSYATGRFLRITEAPTAACSGG